MQRLGRNDPLPDGMQGHWVDAEDPGAELVIEGGEVTCFGEVVAYDYKEIDIEDGATTVSLMINDLANEDTFQRANITGLALAPDGSFHAYNIKFAAEFVRRR